MLIGKKNIVFGVLYLALTAAVGAVMILKHFGDRRKAETEKSAKVSVLQKIKGDSYEKDLQPVTALDLAKANTEAILALSTRANVQKPINSLRSGPHTHGTGEAILNILAGILLMFIAAPGWLKQTISWIFIVGTTLHSGMLTLRMVFGVDWAAHLLSGPPGAIGRGLMLTGLVVLGITAAFRLGATVVKD